MRFNKEEALTFLRRIAMSETTEEFQENVKMMKKSRMWLQEDAKHFRNWIEKTWLPIHQVNLY